MLYLSHHNSDIEFPSPSGISVLLISLGRIMITFSKVSVPFGDIGSSNKSGRLTPGHIDMRFRPLRGYRFF